MFDRLYMGVLDMSKTAAMVIAVVLLVRLLLKKAPKVFSYALWAVVLFRLLCPNSFLTDMESHNRWHEGLDNLMQACEHERQMLAALGTDTVRYCFDRFEAGGNEDLYGQIMAYVCSEILEARGVRPIKDWSFQQSGQDWFDAFTEQNMDWQDLIQGGK